MDSPIYAGVDGGQYRNAGGRMTDSQAAAFERRLRLQEEFVQNQANGLRGMQMSPSYDYSGYGGARFNAMQSYYPMAQLGIGAAALVNRAQREHDPTQVVRSPLLEEFRANSKGNKRYELKDIYNHVVEFSGDQHGSRFIQQKLETANSDEKEQVFREIQPNCLQLMTDVFGNYVVQKLFEHGNQTQKKILANQMRGHVLALSTQMYGCRVVQKALEHILTDQQAAMVKELENHVLKCVRDQNGNHVIQKAIERVPSHYVQFIINAFRGQVNRLAAHPYGCRVIQRMLEHCEEVDRESILGELHACTSNLIPDQFGNYVIQHVIENGDEKDRNRMIIIVMSQLLAYSKHKFASNVVEKSIEFGEESQRHHIISTLTSPNERGESPLLGLMRDQYGNYVIRKLSPTLPFLLLWTTLTPHREGSWSIEGRRTRSPDWPNQASSEPTEEIQLWQTDSRDWKAHLRPQLAGNRTTATHHLNYSPQLSQIISSALEAFHSHGPAPGTVCRHRSSNPTPDGQSECRWWLTWVQGPC